METMGKLPPPILTAVKERVAADSDVGREDSGLVGAMAVTWEALEGTAERKGTSGPWAGLAAGTAGEIRDSVAVFYAAVYM